VISKSYARRPAPVHLIVSVLRVMKAPVNIVNPSTCVNSARAMLMPNASSPALPRTNAHARRVTAEMDSGATRSTAVKSVRAPRTACACEPARVVTVASATQGTRGAVRPKLADPSTAVRVANVNAVQTRSANPLGPALSNARVASDMRVMGVIVVRSTPAKRDRVEPPKRACPLARAFTSVYARKVTRVSRTKCVNPSTGARARTRKSRSVLRVRRALRLVRERSNVLARRDSNSINRQRNALNKWPALPTRAANGRHARRPPPGSSNASVAPVSRVTVSVVLSNRAQRQSSSEAKCRSCPSLRAMLTTKI